MPFVSRSADKSEDLATLVDTSTRLPKPRGALASLVCRLKEMQFQPLTSIWSVHFLVPAAVPVF